MHLKREIGNSLVGVVNHFSNRRGQNFPTSMRRSLKSLKYSQIYDVVCQLALIFGVQIVGVPLNFAEYNSSKSKLAKWSKLAKSIEWP